MKHCRESAQPLQLHRFHEHDGLLVSDSSVSRGNQRGWILWSPVGDGPAAFSLDVECPGVDLTNLTVSIGIVPAGVVMARLASIHSSEDCKGLPLYRVLIESGEVRLCAADKQSSCSVQLGADASSIGLDFFPREQARMSLRVGKKVVDLSTDFPKAILNGTYRPVLGTSCPELKLRCRVSWRNVKRKLDASYFLSQTCRVAWEARKYTDMVICTEEDHCIPCHRIHLAQASPVIEAELDRWSGSSPRVKVSGDRAAVEAMVAFCYTGQLEESANAAAMLTLAHRYQIDDLVTLAANRMLETLTPETVVTAMRALRPLRHQEGLQIIWRELCFQVAHDISIVEALGVVV
eukprot:TRINITY_DN14223_c0_g3_i1.p1 TRINITY_DN14223_c0_g3~~TRINITY_DN14223_c0_g3_i1.p1  ORF type:complete len:349 (+),score=38.54 TRINITY_DN14223_c0_g3_i1:144-1190(+)